MFEVGMYVRYMNRIWIIEDVDDKMMFLTGIDDNLREMVFAWDYDKVEMY